MADEHQPEGRRAPPVPDTSADVRLDRLQELAAVLPGAVIEGKLDIERLREAVGDVDEDVAERYTFSWAGRRNAIQILQTPTRATLAPVHDESVEWEETEHVFI